MKKVITFSRVFPAYHPRKGEQTRFVEQLLNSFKKQGYHIDTYEVDRVLGFSLLDRFGSELGEKNHTIRSGNRWKVGDKFSPRVWSGKPYNSKMITIAPDMEIKKVWDFEIKGIQVFINGKIIKHTHFSEFYDFVEGLAKNDGLTGDDLLAWFKFPTDFKGQIICWNNEIEY